MTMPSFTKTWTFDVNNRLKGTGTEAGDGRQLMFAIKTMILSWGNWTVLRSSSSTAVANSDLWLTSANVVFALNANVKSWIVLNRADIGLSLCISCNTGGTATYRYAEISATFDGYDLTTGDTTNKPTVNAGGYEVTIVNRTFYVNLGTTQYDLVLHAMTSTDNQAQRIVVYNNNTVVSYISFEYANEPITTWAKPFVCCWLAGAPTYALLSDVAAATAYYKGWHTGAAWFTNWVSTEGYGPVGATTYLGERVTVANEMTDEFTLSSCGMVSPTVGRRGYHGRFYDLWCSSTTLSDGDTLPATSPTRKFIVFGDFVFPWDGSSTPLTT